MDKDVALEMVAIRDAQIAANDGRRHGMPIYIGIEMIDRWIASLQSQDGDGAPQVKLMHPAFPGPSASIMVVRTDDNRLVGWMPSESGVS